MRTGRYRFETRYTQRRWFTPPRPVQALMVEHLEPIDQNIHGIVWRPATASDALTFEREQTERRVQAELAQLEVEKLRTRLDVISTHASMP